MSIPNDSLFDQTGDKGRCYLCGAPCAHVHELTRHEWTVGAECCQEAVLALYESEIADAEGRGVGWAHYNDGEIQRNDDESFFDSDREAAAHVARLLGVEPAHPNGYPPPKIADSVAADVDPELEAMRKALRAAGKDEAKTLEAAADNEPAFQIPWDIEDSDETKIYIGIPGLAHYPISVNIGTQGLRGHLERGSAHVLARMLVMAPEMLRALEDLIRIAGEPNNKSDKQLDQDREAIERANEVAMRARRGRHHKEGTKQ